MKPSLHLVSLLSRISGTVLVVLLVGELISPALPAQAAAALAVTPLAWNITGLDSNDVTSGPNHFPVGARVCNTGDVAAANVKSSFDWTSSDAYIDLRAGTSTAYTADGVSLDPGQCTDFYYEVEITRNAAAYDHTRRYVITAAADGGLSGSTPTPREIYVEHLISQNRNSVTNVKLDGVSIPNGGTMALTVGNTYTIELDGGTATNGYNQLESFISLPNTVFQILSVSSTYSVSSLGSPISLLYADLCGWDNNPTSPTYRSCIGSDGKSGGTVATTYQIKIIGGGGTSQSLNTLLYDFSGSSFHYNSDFSSSARTASIIDPTQVTFSKAFSPASAVAGGSSTLIFTLANPTPSTLTGIHFTDDLPASPGAMTVANPPHAATSGCGAPTFSPTSGDSSISFADGSIAPNSICTVSVSVSIPSTPTTGTYANTSNSLYIGSVDTGHTANADLELTTTAAGTGICGLTLAKWTLPSNDTTPPTPTTLADNVSVAAASAGQGLTGQLDTSSGNPIGSLQLYGWPKSGPIVTGTSPYYQFAIDTSQYTQVKMQFDAQRKSNGPDNVFIYYSANGSTWTQENSTAINASTGAFTAFGPYDFTGQTNGSGATYFRVYGWGANATSQGNDINLDNVAFTGCGEPEPLTISKAFQPNPIAVNGVSQLTFTLTNPNSAQLSGVQFQDTFPDGMQVASTPAASTSNCGTPTFAPASADTSLTFSGGSLAANGTCTVNVNVTASTAGPHTNISGFVSSTESGTNSSPSGSATASLTALQPPVLAKDFAPNPILTNGTSTLTFVVTNPNPDDSLPNVSFTDTFPTSPDVMQVAGAPNASTSGCGAPTFSPVAGAGSISFSNGTIAAGGQCRVQVDITAPATGDYANISGVVSATIATVTSEGNSAEDTLKVNAPHPGLTLSKQVSSSASGPWTPFVVVSPGADVYYRLIIENTGDVPLSSISVTDPDVSLAGCSWPGTLPVASPTQDPTAECTVGPITAQLGDTLNTASAQGAYGSTPYTSASTAEYVGANSGLTLVKQAGASTEGPWSSSLTGVAPASNIYYKFTVINTGGLALSPVSVTDTELDMSSCTLTDPLPENGATFCVVGPVTAASTIGTYTNTATAHGSSLENTYDSEPSSASYTLSSPDLTVTKANDTGDGGAVGTAFTWSLTVANVGTAEATFTDGQALLSDTLPANATYGDLTTGSFTDITNSANISCGITTGTLLCSASGKDVSIATGGSFEITYSATPTATGNLANTATVDPNGSVTESDESNNTGSDTVTVNATTADLEITKTDGVASVSPNGNVAYTLVVANHGPDKADGATLRDAAVTGIQVSGVTCNSATNGAVCPTSGNTVADLQGAGIVIQTLPNGGSLTFTVAATITATSGTVTNTATITPPEGTSDTSTGNNSGSDSDTVTSEGARTYTLFMPLVSGKVESSSVSKWGVELGYEDLPLSSGLNDFDYNDWAVAIDGATTYASASSNLMQKMVMSFTPLARGASYDHQFQVFIPAQKFPSNGSAVLTLYDQNHTLLSTQTIPFVGGVDNVFVIFSKTSTVFPGSVVNSIEGKTPVPAQRYAQLSIVFDTPFPFTLDKGDLSLPHGQGLFFDPRLNVLNTGEQVHMGDIRLLSVPSTSWLWPEEGVRIDRAYPSVIYSAGNPPGFTFPLSWWTNFNHCVYDGVKCGTP